ncbi:MAG: MFS transporter [Muribaculaceae bacterium]|nr:MFS transporter [Muribaculaceae bacterium]
MKGRLSLLYFLQFGVWGCYLSCFGQLLGAGGLGPDIQWFYAAVGIVSLLTPALFGHIADRFVPSVRMLGLSHLCGSILMFCLWIYASSRPHFSFWPFFLLYLGFLLFYMPTMALANTTTFALLKSKGLRPVDRFPYIRIWGTIGFVAAMWFVNSAYIYDGVFGFTLNDMSPAASRRFQYTSMQLLSSSMLGLLTAFYTLTLPVVREGKPKSDFSVAEIFGFRAFRLFRIKDVRTFLVFAVFIGVCLQISNGFAVPFVNHFMAFPEYIGSLASGNATLLFSLSQISEAAFMVITGIAMKRIGFKWVISLAMLAWCLRFLFLGIGDPGEGLGWLLLSMIVYGIAFNFFNIAGHIYMDQKSDKTTKGFGQGLLMMMSNGIGATGGMIAAGAVVNHFCHWEMMPAPSGEGMMRLFMGDWLWPWLIFAIYALVVLCFFVFFFRNAIQKTTSNRNKTPLLGKINLTMRSK